MANAINYQTESIKNKKHQTDETAMTYAENARYQMEIYNSVKFVNKIFLSLYIILFIFIHVMFVIPLGPPSLRLLVPGEFPSDRSQLIQVGEAAVERFGHLWRFVKDCMRVVETPLTVLEDRPTGQAR
jgi:hypothetical protein